MRFCPAEKAAASEPGASVCLCVYAQIHLYYLFIYVCVCVSNCDCLFENWINFKEATERPEGESSEAHYATTNRHR